MSFQAYLDNIEAKTGLTPAALRERAVAKGLADASGLAPGRTATDVVDWLKSEFGLGHGHAMAIVAYIKGKRN